MLLGSYHRYFSSAFALGIISFTPPARNSAGASTGPGGSGHEYQPIESVDLEDANEHL
jgi:hypothetical protein